MIHDEFTDVNTDGYVILAKIQSEPDLQNLDLSFIMDELNVAKNISEIRLLLQKKLSFWNYREDTQFWFWNSVQIKFDNKSFN